MAEVKGQLVEKEVAMETMKEQLVALQVVNGELNTIEMNTVCLVATSAWRLLELTICTAIKS